MPARSITTRQEPERKSPEPDPIDQPLAAQAGTHAERKFQARWHGKPSIWFGPGMAGVIGCPVVMPTLLGAAPGMWLEQRHPGGCSWTLALPMGGLALACLNAWRWVPWEDKAIHGS